MFHIDVVNSGYIVVVVHNGHYEAWSGVEGNPDAPQVRLWCDACHSTDGWNKVGHLKETSNCSQITEVNQMCTFLTQHGLEVEKEQDVAAWYSIRSWCDGSSDRSLMVN